MVRGAARYGNPLARLSWRRASLILAQNPETRDWLPSRHRAKVEVLPNAVLETLDRELTRRDPNGKVVLFAARLLPWKGGHLAVRVIAHLAGWELLIAGSGPDEARLRRLAWRLGVTDRVAFLGHLPRATLHALMTKDADVLLFPSMHEDAGWVVAEADTWGLPVVALARGGPPLLGAVVATPGTIEETVERLAASVTSLESRDRHPSQAFELNTKMIQVSDLLARRDLLPAVESRS